MSDFTAKVHKIRFPLGLRPRPRLGSLQRSPYSLAVFNGPTSKGKVGKEGGGREGKSGGVRRGKGRGQTPTNILA